MGAAGSEQGAVGAGRAERAPGAGCGWSEGRGVAEGGGGGAEPDRGCVGGGGRCRFHQHRGSAGRSRRSGPAGWTHRAFPLNLPNGGKINKTQNITGENKKKNEKNPRNVKLKQKGKWQIVCKKLDNLEAQCE